MTRVILNAFPKSRIGILVIFGALLIAVLAFSVEAQSPQLTLADLLIGLRSKKATLDDRNSILTEAVSARGVTFALTPEIEKELASTGAGRGLLDSIRKKAQIVKVAMTNVPPVETAAKPEVKPPPAPDFAFYEKRAAASIVKGEIDPAIEDFTKAIEMNPTSATAVLGRAGAYLVKKLWVPAVADYTKVLELSPKNSVALAGRGDAHEKLGELDLAAADFIKLLEIEPDNQLAKSNASRIQAELTKLAEKAKPQPPPIEKPSRPQFVTVGVLNEANATHMAKPAYPPMAYKSRIGGKVTIELTLDEEGNVTEAKAVDGHVLLRRESEEAAKRSKFKPIMFDGAAIKAKGTLVYNFVNPLGN